MESAQVNVSQARGAYRTGGQRDIWILKGDRFSISIKAYFAHNMFRSFIKSIYSLINHNSRIAINTLTYYEQEDTD